MGGYKFRNLTSNKPLKLNEKIRQYKSYKTKKQRGTWAPEKQKGYKTPIKRR